MDAVVVPPVTDEELLTSADGGILTLTLNRPHRRNAVTPLMRDALIAALDDAARSGQRVVVLRGAGDGFCAGADVAGAQPVPGVPTVRRMRVGTQRLVQEVLENPLPVIAAVHGPCAGFGVSLALAADFCVAAEDARFVPAFGRIGLAPDGAVALTLTRALGVVAARRFLMLQEPLTGADAARAGLVHAAVPGDELEAATTELARRLAAMSSGSLQAAKAQLARATAGELQPLLAEERGMQAVLMASEDHQEGLKAFQERRPPVFPEAPTY